MIKNVCGLLGLGTLQSAVSEEWIDEMDWDFACWCKLRKAKSCFNIYWVGVVKHWRGLINHGTLKSGVSHKWCHKLSRLIEWFLHADSDEIIFNLMANLLCIFDIKMQGDHCSCTKPEFLGKIPFAEKRTQNRLF